MRGKKNENRLIAGGLLDDICIKTFTPSRIQLFEGVSHRFLVTFMTLVIVKGEWQVDEFDATLGVCGEGREMVEDDGRCAPNDGHIGHTKKDNREGPNVH